MNLLSINSHVACGHVGNAAAVFALQRLGCEVWPIHTVLFSNHPGHESFRGETVEASTVRKLVSGIEERGLFPSCDGVLSGYLGKPETGEAILEALAKVKAANPTGRYCCDPVIGDTGRGVYVQCEAISLTRDVPAGLNWLVGSFVQSVPRESLDFTLRSTRNAVLRGGSPAAH